MKTENTAHSESIHFSAETLPSTPPTKPTPEETATWTPTQWEKYLQSIESPQKEVLFPRFELWLEQHMTNQQAFFEESGWPGRRISDMDLDEAIQKLSQKKIKIIEAIFWDGLTQKQTAEKLKISKSTVQTYLKRSLKQLRRHLSCKLPI